MEISKIMPNRKIRGLTEGYTSEVDLVDEQAWNHILLEFDDSNIYQTWQYGETLCGPRNMSHLVLKKNGIIVAIAQARISKFLKFGIAYVHWGPLWRRLGTELDIEIFREAIRALRNEFVCKRGLAVRVFPVIFDDLSSNLSTILADEGFSSLSVETRSRTILMELDSPIEHLRDGMKPHWKRELKVAERNGLSVSEGSGDELFEAFIGIYKEMVSRKNFVEPNDINQFRSIQAKLPENLKMKIMLSASGDSVSSGLVCSHIGNTAIYLFGATSNAGLKSRGSYLLHWKLLETLKRNGAAIYNLNGINPTKNPGTFKFKSDLAGKHGMDVHYLGRFDAHPGFISNWCIERADEIRTKVRTLKHWSKTRSALAVSAKAT